MFDPVDDLSRRAKLLMKKLERGETSAILRLEALPYRGEIRDAQHKHCLAVIAKELGFTSHEHAARVLRGEPDAVGYGFFLHTYGGFLNTWFVDYDEARRAIRPEFAFLLGYNRQYVVVERGYIEELGLDPDDPDWKRVDWDLARPRDRAAAVRLYARRLRAFRQEESEHA